MKIKTGNKTVLKNILFVVILFFSESLFAQSGFQQFLNRVNSISDSTEKAAVVDSFMTVARQQGIPFIEDNTANFIYLGNPNSVAVAGDFNGWNPNVNLFNKLNQTNFWYYSQQFESNARVDYKLVLNGNNWILDPENPHTILGGFGPNSELAMPEYVQPWEIEYNPNIEHGSIVTTSIVSSHVNETFQLKIYLPPGYDENSQEVYPTAYFQDGFEYITLGSAVNVIDNLLDSNKIKPVIAVFVKPNNRNEEYAGGKRNQYRLFFVEELVPLIDSLYKTIQAPTGRLVLGDSFGGNISALISYHHPGVFGLCGLHSGAFWPNDYETYNLIVNGAKENIKWNSVWGSYEGTLAVNMHNFQDSLQAKGYEFQQLELPEGHSWGLWRANIDRFLEYFFPPDISDVKETGSLLPEKFKLYQNYPNPFNPETKIRYKIPGQPQNNNAFLTLKVYDVLGNDIATLVDGQKSTGTFEVNFNAAGLASGIYYYRLIAGNFAATKKMVVLK